MTDGEKRTLRKALTVHERFGSTNPCKWFAMCENDATTTRKHPVLGDVPICKRCDEKTERLMGKK